MVKVYIMGQEYEVPEGLTIMKTMEYAGYLFMRGAGCRAGFCDACGTVYRLNDDYHLQPALACQTAVEDGMVLAQIPFVPVKKALYDGEQKLDNTIRILRNGKEWIKLDTKLNDNDKITFMMMVAGG